MQKNALRKKYKKLRMALTNDDVEELSLRIANELLKVDIWHYEFFHIFLPIEEQKEVNTEYILNILAGKDKNIIVSKSDFSTRQMSHFLLSDSTTLKKNSYNIPEPIGGIEISTDKINVVFVPLLAYDQHGNRVGYGKGFYDRFLSECDKSTVKVGVSFFTPETRILDNGFYDVKLDYCVTPEGIVEF